MLYLGIAVALAVLYGIFLFNRLVTLRQAWGRAASDIDVQLRLRHDLIPNLVETVKAYATHESGVFTEVAQARSAAMHANTIAEKSTAETALSGALGNLFAVAENYPQLKASENFRALQDQLSDVENKIAAARRFMNNAAAEYNSAAQQFPALLIASPFGFRPAGMFTLDAEERLQAKEAPKVSFAG